MLQIINDETPKLFGINKMTKQKVYTMDQRYLVSKAWANRSAQLSLKSMVDIYKYFMVP